MSCLELGALLSSHGGPGIGVHDLTRHTREQRLHRQAAMVLARTDSERQKNYMHYRVVHGWASKFKFGSPALGGYLSGCLLAGML